MSVLRESASARGGARLLPRVRALAERFGVRVLDRRPGDSDPVFPWSFFAPGRRNPSGMHVVGPKTVYLQDWPRDCYSAAEPPWAVLLHEVGHAYTGVSDEAVVSGWAQAAAATLGQHALRTMRAYDRDASPTFSPQNVREAAVSSGFLTPDGGLLPCPF